MNYSHPLPSGFLPRIGNSLSCLKGLKSFKQKDNSMSIGHVVSKYLNDVFVFFWYFQNS